MSPYLIVEGILIGFVVAVPVGPLGLLCISRGLAVGALCGLLSGLGVATADAFAAGVAALGISFVSGFLSDYQIALRMVGGIFLCYLGWQTFWSEPEGHLTSSPVKSLFNAYATTFFLTISNPMTMLSFIAIYAGWHVPSLHGHYFAAAALALGVFTGSASWWVGMFIAITACHGKFNLRAVHWVHRISGVLIGGFGVAVLLSLTPLKTMIGIEF
jgi:threonine/homoserine/homoserine lactone efflux protein